MNINALDKEENPSILVKDNFIIAVNSAFFNLTEFKKEDLEQMAFSKFWNEMLRINVDCGEIVKQNETFLFTKNLESRLVIIEKNTCDDDGTIYTFIEVANSRLEKRVPYIEYMRLNSDVGVAIFSAPDCRLLRVNQTYLNFLDDPYREASNSIGKTIFEITTNFFGSFAHENWIKTLQTGKVFDIKEMPYDGFQRGITYWNILLVPFYEDESIRYLVLTTEEVTDSVIHKKTIEEQTRTIRQQKEQLEAVIDNMSDALVVFDSNGDYIIKNGEAKRSLYTDTYQRIGDSYRRGLYYDLSGNELSYEQIPSMRVLKGEKITEQILRVNIDSDNNRYISVNGMPIFNADGSFNMGIMSIRDVTDIINQTEIIKWQKEQLDIVLEEMKEALFIFDKNGKYILVNKTGRRNTENNLKKLGDSYDVIEYFDLDGNAVPYESTPNFKVLHGEAVSEMILHAKSKKQDRYISISGSPILDKDGKLLYGVVTGRDVTEIIKLENTIKEQKELLLKSEIEKRESLENALKMKDEFLYLITHEFRTPMAVVNSALQAIHLMYKDDVSPRIGKYLNTIKQNNNRQLRLVNNLLDIAKISSGNFRLNIEEYDIVHLTKAIIKSVELYAAQKKVNLSFSSDLDYKLIYIDEEKYERIILNLIANALKFTAKGKNINIYIEQIEHKGIDMISISVIDEGIGIPKEKQNIIFERFGQADNSLSRGTEGTGLGLHLVKLLVGALNGDITLESDLNKGSKFSVFLPIQNEQFSVEVAACSEFHNKFETDDSRIIQAASIEFSDIYFD